jgi:nitroimidazol reductase NimA-like FMN-containing flavoprotein (pyridoxamine 5'-phosphate oxidase superfamily)
MLVRTNIWRMPIEQDAARVLSDDQAWDRLSSVSLGRLVTNVGGQMEIFPVNFATQNNTVVFRTAEGTKLFGTVMNEQVLFEADDHTVAEGWSVIIRGKARVLTTTDEINDADRAQVIPWVPTEKLRYVRITPDEMSGRHFRFGPEPQHGGLPG